MNTKPTKVLYWTNLFWPNIGGVEILSTQFLPAMQQRGYEFEVVTGHHDTQLGDLEYWNGIPVHRLPYHDPETWRNLPRFLSMRARVAEIKKRFQPDLVHINYAEPSVLFHLQTKTGCPVPDVLTVQSLSYEQLGPDSIQGKALHGVDRVIVTSQDIREDVLAQAPDIADHCRIIWNGSLKGNPEPIAPLDFDPPRLLGLGRFVRDKGFDLAIEALARVKDEFPGVRLVLSGDGPERASLEQQARDLGVAGQVEFPGWSSPDVNPEPVLNLINSASMVVMPSRWKEPFGLIALQGAQMGRPVIASRTGGLREIVADGETGLLFERENAEDLAVQLRKLLRDPALAQRMGVAAVKRAETEFGWEKYIGQYDALFQELLG